MKIPFVLYVAIVVGIFGTLIELPRETHLVEEVHAAESFDIVEDVPQNDFYCRQLAEKWEGIHIVGGNAEAIRSLCADEGVEL